MVVQEWKKGARIHNVCGNGWDYPYWFVSEADITMAILSGDNVCYIPPLRDHEDGRFYKVVDGTRRIGNGLWFRWSQPDKQWYSVKLIEERE